MPRLSFYQRERIVSLYLDNNLSGTKEKFYVLKELATYENIFASELTFRRTITRWIETGRIDDNPARIRNIKNTKITVGQLTALDNLIYEDRGMSVKKAKKWLIHAKN